MTDSVSHQLSIRWKKKKNQRQQHLSLWTAAPPPHCTRKNSTNSPSVSGSFGDIHLREFRILIQLTPARVRTEGLKLSVKVVHVVCDCRLDSSWIQNRQMVKFFNKKCRLNIFIFKCENHVQNLKCFTNLRSGILFSCISSWYCLPLMKPRLLLFVAFQNGTIAYWWRSATED